MSDDPTMWGAAAAGAASAGVIATAVGGYLVARVKARAGAEAERVRAQVETTRATEATAAEATRTDAVIAPRLLAWMTTQEQRIDVLRRECEQERIADRAEHERQRQADREECERQRREDREECDREIEVLAADVKALAAELTKERRSRIPEGLAEDDTGLHRLDEIAHRPTPSSRPELPAAARREETKT